MLDVLSLSLCPLSWYENGPFLYKVMATLRLESALPPPLKEDGLFPPFLHRWVVSCRFFFPSVTSSFLAEWKEAGSFPLRRF